MRTLEPGATVEDESCERWLDQHCLKLSELRRDVLAVVDARLGIGDRGQPLASSTAARYRKIARACVARVRRAVDVRRLPDPVIMARAIDAMATHQPGSRTYQAMTAVAYHAGLRSSEVVVLRPRSVPIPPILVDRLREWVDERGIAPDELLFRTRTDRMSTASNWARAWQRALRSIGQPSLRVYDCRHAAATTWLRAGVPLDEETV